MSLWNLLHLYLDGLDRQQVFHMATFADELKLSVVETWQKILNHKFINEIYNDTLPIDKFIFYLEQDRIFLDELCRFLSVVKQKSDNNIDLVKL